MIRWHAIGLALALSLPALGQQAAPPPAGPASPKVSIDVFDPRQVMERGGPLLWPILVCSIVTVALGLERWISLRRARVVAPKFSRKFLDELRGGRLDRATALEVCRHNGSPMAAVFEEGLKHWGRPRVEVRAAVDEVGMRQVALLRRNLRALQGSANIATLLGLLGTILGMIEAFNDVAQQQGLGRAEVLANGIAQALLTTAAGLAVAIPSLFLHTYFAGRVERLVFEMDQFAAEIVESASGPADPGSSGGNRAGAPARDTFVAQGSAT